MRLTGRKVIRAAWRVRTTDRLHRQLDVVDETWGLPLRLGRARLRAQGAGRASSPTGCEGEFCEY